MRIVDAAGADVCACCGTHVARAGEVQLAKFIDITRHKGHTVIEALFGGARFGRLPQKACGAYAA